MSKPSLGIMALYMNDKKKLEDLHFYRQLLIEGKKMDLHTFLFTPEDVHDKKQQIRALYYDETRKKWYRKWTPMPDVIFDRCRFQLSPRFRKLQEFRSKYPNLLYLNRPLANKWIIYQYLHQIRSIRPHLPETKLVQQTNDVFKFMEKHSLAFYKPINGTGGRGILKIEKRTPNTFKIEGRTQQRKIIPAQTIHASKLRQLLARWKANTKRNFIIQQGIQLKLADGRVHDYRQLIQKNGSGQWEITGCAGRVGAKRSITSNLHGGGKAVPMDELMKKWFKSSQEIEAIKSKVAQLGFNTVHALEEKYTDMCELALDIAIDRTGHPWLLEINPKPAREVFKRINERETYRTSIIRPLQYALWLYKERKSR